jgi:hypothetical protein
MLHRFVSEPINITKYVKAIRSTHSIRAPWETLQMVLSMPRPLQFLGGLDIPGRDRRSDSPRIGDWVVFYDDAYDGKDDARAVFWGYITNDGSNIRALRGGAIESGTVQVTALGWFDYLGRARIQKAPGAIRPRGGLLSPSQWDGLFKGLVGAAQQSERVGGVVGGEIRRRDVGASLQEALEVVALTQLPQSLGGAEKIQREVQNAESALLPSETVVTTTNLGIQVRVVHDADTRDQFAPNMAVDPVPGWTIRGIQAFSQRQSTALQLILGTFGGDPNMIELFPSLEEPGAVDTPSQTGQSNVYINPNDEDEFGFGSIEGTRRGKKEDTPKEGTAGGGVGKGKKKVAPSLANETSRALGANPVLVYRMRPWRDEELSDYISRNDTLGRKVSRKNLDDDVFRGITWRGNRGAIRSYGASDIINASHGFDDAEHVNCVTIGLPTQADSDIKWLERSGLPLMAPHHPRFGGIITQRGLRIYEPDWPFFPPFQDDNTSLMQSLITVATQAAQFMGAADRFATGIIDLRYDSTLRPGMFIDAIVPESGDGVMLRAYAESVTHSIEVGEKGEITARTQVVYSRGMFNESVGSRGRQFVPIRGDEAL